MVMHQVVQMCTFAFFFPLRKGFTTFIGTSNEPQTRLTAVTMIKHFQLSQSKFPESDVSCLPQNSVSLLPTFNLSSLRRRNHFHQLTLIPFPTWNALTIPKSTKGFQRFNSTHTGKPSLPTAVSTDSTAFNHSHARTHTHTQQQAACPRLQSHFFTHSCSHIHALTFVCLTRPETLHSHRDT